MKIKTLITIGTCAALTSIGWNIILTNKQKRIDRIMDEIVESVANKIDIDVPEYMIEQAVERVTKTKAESSIQSAVRRVTNDISKDIKRTVEDSVYTSKEEIKPLIKKELQRQIGNINIDTLKSQVKEEAREIAVDRFKISLDTILEEHNAQLASVQKIYASIADNISKK